MKRKRLKIDWEGLEEAFDRPPDEVPAYLDRVTGRVVLEGEGEEDEGGGGAGGPRNDSVRVYVLPPDLQQKVDWMEAFVDGRKDLDEGLRIELSAALTSLEPAEAVGELWRSHPVEREAWFAFRADRLHELIESWLDEAGIEPIDPPPWK
jgi:hypothetical protein